MPSKKPWLEQVLYVMWVLTALILSFSFLSADIFLNKAKKVLNLSGVEDRIKELKNPSSPANGEEEPIDARVTVKKNPDGTWQLFVDDKPFFIKGMIFNPAKIGEDPGIPNLRDWMLYDDNANSTNDIAFETWVDTNLNNIKDATEPLVGDFQLLKDMGCNTIRLYHVPSDNPILGNIYKIEPGVQLQYDHAVNKSLLRKLYNDYGIMVIMSHFLGSWTIGAGVSWAEGCDYTNSTHRENIKTSVRAMVLDNKDEPYVLMWLLGNENNIADFSKCNAVQHPVAYAQLIGELARMIKEIDPHHPVAVCDGDGYRWFADPFNTLREYPDYAQAVDIVAFNSYHGSNGFNPYICSNVKYTFDRPIFYSEYGMFAYDNNVGYDEMLQKKYHTNYWKDIVLQSASNLNIPQEQYGNCIGGVVFDWCDRWHMDGNPWAHDVSTNPATYSPDGLRHEEWFGVTSMGIGSDTLMRQKRSAYDYYKNVWNRTNLTY
ncbi:MAG: hypothetical protein JW827_03175 [Spirochaetes bacterium]|nr:hypothetical protein [Spirochaetota bacterium]